jgi:hypothetical protein
MINPVKEKKDIQLFELYSNVALIKAAKNFMLKENFGEDDNYF